MRLDIGNAADGGKSDKAKISGVLVGIVTNNQDPDKLGRVKLKFPIRENEHETDWAPIATLMGGKDMGSLFIPEVGDEVLVAFHLGYLNKPYVIGSLWTSQKKPPPPNEKNDLRMLKSRSGHELTFNDKDGDTSVTLKTKDGHELTMSDKDSVITLKNKSGNQKMVIDGASSGKITIEAGSSKITLSGNGQVQIEGSNTVEVKAAQLKLEASAQMSLKAGAKLDLAADGIISIKGSMVKIN